MSIAEILYSSEGFDLIRGSNFAEYQSGEEALGRVLFRNRIGFLPPGVRAHFEHRRNDGDIWIYEAEPAVKMISYRGAEFHIPVPWQVYFISRAGNRYSVSRMFFNTGPIQTMQDRMYFAHLPNVYLDDTAGGRICASNQMSVAQIVEGTRIRLDKTFAAALDAFWSSNFNDDITAFTAHQPFIHFVESNHPDLRGAFSNWEKIPLELVLSLPWAQSKWPLDGLIAQCEWGDSIPASLKARDEWKPVRRNDFASMIQAAISMENRNMFVQSEPMRRHNEAGEYLGTAAAPAQVAPPLGQ